MKRQISICILLAIIVIALALLYIRFFNENGGRQMLPDKNKILVENASETEVKPNVPAGISNHTSHEKYYFCAKDEDGYVFIYDVMSKTIYMETFILVENLPVHLAEKLENGIFFRDEEELFSFLESYSS